MNPSQPSANTSRAVHTSDARILKQQHTSPRRIHQRSDPRRKVGIFRIPEAVQASLVKRAKSDFAGAALEFAFGGGQGELESWTKLLHDPDSKIRLAAHKFLTIMRDGTPRKADPKRTGDVNLIFELPSPDAKLPEWIRNSPVRHQFHLRRPDGTVVEITQPAEAADLSV